jgi:hypothetical protein
MTPTLRRLPTLPSDLNAISEANTQDGIFEGIVQTQEAARHFALASPCLGGLVGKRLRVLAIPMLTCLFGGGAAPLPTADAQGWKGSGWYVASAASATTRPDDVPAYILFNGPYPLQSGCLEVYDRLYSPIGSCRFLNLKPAAFGGQP